jgi:hypothetical protein
MAGRRQVKSGHPRVVWSDWLRSSADRALLATSSKVLAGPPGNPRRRSITGSSAQADRNVCDPPYSEWIDTQGPDDTSEVNP